MKKFSKILFVGLLTIVMGCNDAIDIRQPGRLDALNAFQSVDDLQQGLLAVYNQWDLSPEIALASNFTDEVAVSFDSGGQGFALYDFVLNAGSAAASDFWVRNYRVNNRATLLIEAAANITPEDATEQALFDDVLAQAHAIRAYANLELMTYFSPDPTDDSTLAAPVVDFVAPLDYQPLRNTTGELWDYINSDLTMAASMISTQSSPTFLSADGINAIRARAALTRKDYGQVASLSSQLLASYPLANQAQYQLMFLDADNTEVIFKLERTLTDTYDGQGTTGSVAAGGWAGARFAFVDATITGGSYFEMDRGLFNLLDTNDVRYDVSVAPSSIINPNYDTDPDPVNTDILIIQKYPGSEGKPLMNDLKVFRSSEMLLMLAEARVATNNDLTGAATLIKQLRDARFGSAQAMPSYGTAQEAYAAILDERRIELCFEGHRYKDLKRLGPAANRGVDRDPTDCNAQSGACTLAATDYRFTLPIPIIEINANAGIGGQQNPGY
ncbi:RagB/SusD family nutrient uptake outer membrane protein [Psychroserpens sp. SPM9]|uniref:RagB/SusD family nutrient uptake outer membrane protein n=1 Tax=Psychroserpens sp. SPM9 TaxID=2975598 RepID=UPI0021A83FFC|nr:RagB/SusD family nutrient uptake outer membrane protein [Psychroserpens sp. SPM9]MDG5492622.1 RagB/SusD family nutrient uptake outer membrane protein [Psychroserpens sp. SPM9]